MAQTIYETTPGGLVAQPDRTVATFPSGLVRVDRKYICATSAAAGHRVTLAKGNATPDNDSTPAIDGLYIYPESQEIRRGDGFTEFSVSAYGRTAKTVQEPLLEQQQFEVDSLTRFSAWNISGSIVLLQGEAITSEMINVGSDLLEPFDFFYLSPEWVTVSIVASPDLTYSLSKAAASQIGGSGSELKWSIINAMRSILVATRKYTVSLLNSTSGATKSFTVSIEDPKWNITTQRHFGEFVEIEFETERTNQGTSEIV